MTKSKVLNDGKTLVHPYRFSLTILGCIQNSLMGGLIYGWASIDRTMLAASPLEGGGGAGLTLAETTLIFSRGSSVGMWASLALGILLDHAGPRTCSATGHIMVAMGCQLFAMAHNVETYSIAASLIAFGGPGVQISIFHLANLFPENRFLALGFLNGTITLSYSVLAFFDLVWERLDGGVSFRRFFSGFAWMVLASLAAALLCWPDKPYGLSEQDHHHEQNKERAAAAPLAALEPPIPSAEHFLPTRSNEPPPSGGVKDQPLYAQLFSGTYFRLLIVFVLSSFLANFYLATLSTELADLGDASRSEQHQMARFCTFLMSTGFLCAPLVGWLMDHIGLDLTAILMLLLGQAQCLIVIFFHASRHWMMVSFCAYVLFRSFLFPLFISSLTDRMGFRYYGLLLGTGFASSGLAFLLTSSLVGHVEGDCHFSTVPEQQNALGDDQTAAAEVDPGDCDRGSWLMLHAAEMVVLIVLMLAPLTDYYLQHQQQRDLEPILSLSATRPCSSRTQYGTIESSIEENYLLSRC